jgi:hypothetical protein
LAIEVVATRNGDFVWTAPVVLNDGLTVVRLPIGSRP